MTRQETISFCKKHLGLEFINKDGWTVAKSPFRPNELSPSFRLLKHGGFYDFGGGFKARDIVELASKLNGQSIEEARAWIKSKQEEEKKRPIQINIHIHLSDVGVSSPISLHIVE